MLNKVFVNGRLVKDPARSATSDAKTVCKFTIAVQDDYDKTKAEFIDFVAFGKQAEFVLTYFKKGNQIITQGKLHINAWKDKEGKTRKSPEVILESAWFCGTRDTVGFHPPAIEAGMAPTPGAFSEIPIDVDEELPF